MHCNCSPSRMSMPVGQTATQEWQSMQSPRGASIIATLKPALTMLIDLLPETRRALPAARILPPAPVAADPVPVEYLLHTLAAAMPDDAMLVEEAPSHRPAMQKFMPMRGQDSFYTMASGGLGYGLPASVGIALGHPRRRTVCLIGDGSAMYSIQALWTAAHHKLPLTVVICNNGGYRIIKQRLLAFHGDDHYVGMDFADPPVDFTGLARSLGCEAIRIANPADLKSTLASAFKRPGAKLIEVMVDGTV